MAPPPPFGWFGRGRAKRHDLFVFQPGRGGNGAAGSAIDPDRQQRPGAVAAHQSRTGTAAAKIALAIANEGRGRVDLREMRCKILAGGQNNPCSQPFFSGWMIGVLPVS
jgi:hypothetical protein